MSEDSITTIIWDWNGTLLDDINTSIDSINILLRDRSLPELTIEKYRDIFDFPVRKYYEKSGFDFKNEPFEGPAMQFINLYKLRQNEVNLFPDVKPTLSYLQEKGYRQIILSAMEDSLLKKMVKDFGINEYFDSIYGIKDDFAKEKVSIGKKMIEELCIEPKQCLMIGDTLHDAEVSEECGFRCILFSQGHISKQRLEKTALPIIDKIEELKRIL